MEYTLKELIELVEKLPKSFRQEFYNILAEETFTDDEKRILILDRLNKISPQSNLNE